MTSITDNASTYFAPLSAPAATPSQLGPYVATSTSTPVDTAAIASAASAAVARFEADLYPDWFSHITYTFIALFATFIVVCYGMAWYKIRVADRKMEQRERGWIENGRGRRSEGDAGFGVGTDDDSTDSEDLERGRHERPRRWSSLSSSLSSEMATRSRGNSRSRASYSEEQYSDVESDLESAPRRRRSRTRTRSSASRSDFSSTSSADATASTDDDLSPMRPITTRRPLPRRGRTATADWDKVRAVRYSRHPGRSGEDTGVFSQP